MTTTTDRTAEPTEAFEAHLLGWELRSQVDIAADVAETAAPRTPIRPLPPGRTRPQP